MLDDPHKIIDRMDYYRMKKAQALDVFKQFEETDNVDCLAEAFQSIVMMYRCLDLSYKDIEKRLQVKNRCNIGGIHRFTELTHFWIKTDTNFKKNHL